MKHAVVTGAAGFVGRHMSNHLVDRGWTVHRVDAIWAYGVEQFIATNDKLQTKFDLVVHAAAVGPNRKAIDTEPATFPRNTMLDAMMFDWAIRTKQGRFVYLSSSAVYSDVLNHGTFGPQPFTEWQGTFKQPFDHYGQAKRHGEAMAAAAREAGLPVTVVRPFSGYGSDQSEDFPFRAFVERARRREHPFTIWGNANQVRDWVHIDDICYAIMALAENEVQTPVNICTGVGTSMRELARLCIAEASYFAEITTDANAPMGVMHRVGDPTLLHEFYEPKITIEEGVHRAWAQTDL